MALAHHQPCKDVLGDPLRLRYAAACLLVSITLAAATWKFVEQPVRQRKVLRSRRAVFASCGAVLGGLAFLGMTFSQTKGLPERFAVRTERVASYLGYDPTVPYRSDTCFVTRDEQTIDREACLQVDPKRTNVLLIGDSHAPHLWYGLSQTYKDVNFLQATRGGCRPVIEGSSGEVCIRFIRELIENTLKRDRIDAVISPVIGGTTRVTLATFSRR